MLKKNSRILIVGHGDIIEESLYGYFQENGYTDVFSSSEMSLNTTIQSSVYHFFSEHKPEYVFLSSVRSGGIKANQQTPGDFIYSNLESQNNVIYSANKFGVKKLLYIGSSCVYPKECSQPMKEEYIGTGEMESTSEAYSMAKLAGIKMCQSFRQQYGLNAIAVIPATVYGPGSDSDLETAHVIGALIAKFAGAVSKGENEVIVWGSGNPRREFLYKDDFVCACLFLMNHYESSEVINVGVGEDISIKALAEMVASTVGFKGDIRFDASMPDGTMKKLLDDNCIKKCGWKSEVALAKGVQFTYDSFVK